MSRKPPIPPPEAHSLPYRVCYGDTDRMGRVYYANYFVFFERSRTELLRAAGVPYRQLEEDGYILPVRHCEVHYYGSAEYDDELVLLTWISRLRHATATFKTAVARAADENVLALGTVQLACINEQGRPQSLPEKVLAALEPYQVHPTG